MVKLKDYEILISKGSHQNCGVWARKCLPKTKQILIISNKKVFGFFGKTVQKSLIESNFLCEFHLIGDGERFKNFKSLQLTLEKMSEIGLTRTDAVIALGGGVVGDLAGFAASIYLRGIPFLQIPTTLLAMVDSSVGGKTAINTKFGKNIVGSFYQPKGVLVDIDAIKTLPRREIVAGFCEIIKQSVIGSQELFDETDLFLKNVSISKLKTSENNLHPLESLITSQIQFKASVVENDEFEDVSRNDFRSRKILNFGHTVGHALEKVTNYQRFKHGEAVGVGLIVAAEISKKLEICVGNELTLINDVLHRLGNFPKTSDLNIDKVIQMITYDKKNDGSSVKWILLEKIGSPIIVDGREIPQVVLKKSLSKVLLG
jgi:3-dehydroquinate synthase